MGGPRADVALGPRALHKALLIVSVLRWKGLGVKWYEVGGTVS